jgi:hypothetical protein
MMLASHRGSALLVCLVLSLVACSEAGPPLPSSLSATPSTTAGGAAPGYPSGCQASTLLDPSGNAVDLSGEWAGQWFTGRSEGERTFILQLGDCVWMTIVDARFFSTPEQGESVLGQLLARANPDFSLAGNLVTLLRDPVIGGFSDQQTFAAVRFVIEFTEDGDAVLREDRDAGVPGPRCTQGESACPHPTVLERVSR